MVSLLSTCKWETSFDWHVFSIALYLLKINFWLCFNLHFIRLFLFFLVWDVCTLHAVINLAFYTVVEPLPHDRLDAQFFLTFLAAAERIFSISIRERLTKISYHLVSLVAFNQWTFSFCWSFCKFGNCLGSGTTITFGNISCWFVWWWIGWATCLFLSNIFNF